MLRLICILLLTCIFSANKSYCQIQKKIDSLSIICKRQSTDSGKIIALDKLAESYYIYKLNNKADSILQEELQIADVSDNPNLKFTALFGNAILNIGVFTSSESFEKLLAFLKDGIEYANSQNNYDFMCLGYSRLSYIFRQRGINDSALLYARMGAESSPNLTNDSLKAVMYIELGNAYAANGEMVLACRNYNTAFDVALNVKSIFLQSEIHRNIADIYSNLNQKDEAREEVLKSYEINKENNYRKGLLIDNYYLARITDNIIYIKRAIAEANALNDMFYIMNSKRLMLAYIEVIEKNCDKALFYLENDKELTNSYKNAGLAIYNITVANIYLYGGKPDSALKYFKLSEYDVVNKFEQELITDVFDGTAMTYQALNDWPNAIIYYTKVFDLYKKQNNVSSLADVSDSLSFLYSQISDYKNAYKYSSLAIGFKDEIQKKSNSNDIALLGVVRETRQHEEDLKLHDLKMNRQQNLQYMRISLVICIVFLCMLIVGAFSVSKLTIQLMGYFFFISLFEFLILLIDNSFLNKAVHYEPLKLWLIKIALIVCLVPIQHYLEHNLIKFLQSRKLLEARARFSFKKIWNSVFRHPDNKKDDIEEDTALL